MEIYDIINEIIVSKKYSGIDKSVVERISIEMSKRYKKSKELIKAIKNELHIINASFFDSDSHKLANELLTNATENVPNDCHLSETILSLHTSTEERSACLNEIYSVFLGKYIYATTSIIDIGCGFNPFALPFYHELPNEYHALDINTETINLVNKYFSFFHKNGYNADILDVVSNNPTIQGSLVFLFKIIPLIEQQKKGRSIQFLQSMSFEKAVVSFPIKSMSGKNKGMEQYYSSFFEELIKNVYVVIEKKVIGNELFYVIEKS